MSWFSNLFRKEEDVKECSYEEHVKQIVSHLIDNKNSQSSFLIVDSEDIYTAEIKLNDIFQEFENNGFDFLGSFQDFYSERSILIFKRRDIK